MTAAASSFSRLRRWMSCFIFCLCAAVAVWLHSAPANSPEVKRCVEWQPWAAIWQVDTACAEDRDTRTRASSMWFGNNSSRGGQGACVLKSPIRNWSLRAARVWRSSSQAGSCPCTTIAWHWSQKEAKYRTNSVSLLPVINTFQPKPFYFFIEFFPGESPGKLF